MGMFWNLLQQSRIGEQREKSDTLDTRAARLEQELLETRDSENLADKLV